MREWVSERELARVYYQQNQQICSCEWYDEKRWEPLVKAMRDQNSPCWLRFRWITQCRNCESNYQIKRNQKLLYIEKEKKDKSESNIEIKEKIDHVLIAENLKIKW
jgi:hypothetical protein